MLKGILILDVKIIGTDSSRTQIFNWYRRENRPRSENVIQYKQNCLKKKKKKKVKKRRYSGHINQHFLNFNINRNTISQVNLCM